MIEQMIIFSTHLNTVLIKWGVIMSYSERLDDVALKIGGIVDDLRYVENRTIGSIKNSTLVLKSIDDICQVIDSINAETEKLECAVYELNNGFSPIKS